MRNLERLVERSNQPFQVERSGTGTPQTQYRRGLALERGMERNRRSNLERSTHSLESGTVERSERLVQKR